MSPKTLKAHVSEAPTICVRKAMLYMWCRKRLGYKRAHTSICVGSPDNMCPEGHAVYVVSGAPGIFACSCEHMPLLCLDPQLYYYICVPILLYVYMRPHATISASSYYYVGVVVLVCNCAHTSICDTPQKYRVFDCRNMALDGRGMFAAGTQFTCFSSTKTQILTAEEVQSHGIVVPCMMRLRVRSPNFFPPLPLACPLPLYAPRWFVCPDLGTSRREVYTVRRERRGKL